MPLDLVSFMSVGTLIVKFSGLFKSLTLRMSYRDSMYIAGTIKTRGWKANWWIDLVCLSKLGLNELGTEPVDGKTTSKSIQLIKIILILLFDFCGKKWMEMKWVNLMNRVYPEDVQKMAF